MKYYIIFGPPGAGKGTQAVNMAKKYNLCHVSTGQLLRDEIAAGTALGAMAQELIEHGDFVPDEVVQKMIEAQFRRVKDVDGFLLDGYPRTLSQAKKLDEFLTSMSAEVTAVISLMIPDEEIMARIQKRAKIEGRMDDADSAIIQNRIEIYHNKTAPLIEYYRNAGKYHEINGLGTIEQVGINIDEYLRKI